MFLERRLCSGGQFTNFWLPQFVDQIRSSVFVQLGCQVSFRLGCSFVEFRAEPTMISRWNCSDHSTTASKRTCTSGDPVRAAVVVGALGRQGGGCRRDGHWCESGWFSVNLIGQYEFRWSVWVWVVQVRVASVSGLEPEGRWSNNSFCRLGTKQWNKWLLPVQKGLLAGRQPWPVCWNNACCEHTVCCKEPRARWSLISCCLYAERVLWSVDGRPGRVAGERRDGQRRLPQNTLQVTLAHFTSKAWPNLQCSLDSVYFRPVLLVYLIVKTASWFFGLWIWRAPGMYKNALKCYDDPPRLFSFVPWIESFTENCSKVFCSCRHIWNIELTFCPTHCWPLENHDPHIFVSHFVVFWTNVSLGMGLHKFTTLYFALFLHLKLNFLCTQWQSLSVDRSAKLYWMFIQKYSISKPKRTRNTQNARFMGHRTNSARVQDMIVFSSWKKRSI